MYFATGVEPTKLTARIVGWSRMPSTASLAPFTSWTTPGGKSACSRSLKMSLSGHRHFFAGLDDDAIAGCKRIGHEPERNHAWEVEGCDDGDDAQRLADHVLVNTAGDVLVVVALHQDGRAACHLHVLDGAAHFAHTLGVRLAALFRDGARDGVEVLFQQRLEPEEMLNAIADGRASPIRRRLLLRPGPLHQLPRPGRAALPQARRCWQDSSPPDIRLLWIASTPR